MAKRVTTQPPVDIKTTSSVQEVDEAVQKLAHDLSLIHGTIRIAREASGLHFYMASPYCLEEFGEEELFKLHLAVNVEKYLNGGENFVGMCMKSGEAYDIQMLLSMPPLSQRGYSDTPKVVLKKEQDTHNLEEDANGNLVPKSPGTTLPVLDLPQDHPAHLYLNSRGFNAEMLTEQFNISYCEAERSDMFYRRLSGGFRATPQGRIVFEILQKGIVKGWQARILEIEQNGLIYYWHPYKRKWTAVLQAVAGSKPRPLPGWEDWDPAKYIIAPGCARNEILMGFDKAATFDYRANRLPHFAVLVEGALDAGRIGIPAMAMLGKHLSDGQAALLLEQQFDPIIFVKDQDESGTKAAQSAARQLDKLGIGNRLRIIDPPPGYKDLGEIPTHEEAQKFIYGFL